MGIWAAKKIGYYEGVSAARFCFYDKLRAIMLVFLVDCRTR